MEEQLNLLIQENDSLKKKIEELEDENSCLWSMIDELKASEKSIGTQLQKALIEHIEDEFYKSLKPVGDA
jgi:uncharacterized protein YlxW (UPF0749 family)